MNFIHLTTHSKEQAIRRYALDSENLKRLAQLSVTQGYSINDAPCDEVKKYLKQKQKPNSRVYVYGGYMFVFSLDMVLITTFRLPKKYLHAQRKTGKLLRD